VESKRHDLARRFDDEPRQPHGWEERRS